MNFKNFLTRITNSTFSLQYLFLLFVFLGILSTPIFSQQPDTTIDAVSDTTIVADTTDTLRTLRPPSRSQIQGPIKYWADSISFSLPNQTTHLWGDVRIEYQNVTLTAGKVDIDWPQNVMVAQGIADSTDSLGNKIMTDYPVLTERGQAPINGIRLEYNFKNKRGKVLEGRTEMEPGYYRGEDIRKVGQETLFIKDGYFTTCELDTPHYYFRSDKTRMRLKKEAVAKPIVMYIADVPILAAPFWIFSLKRDRRSGIILPTFGETSFGGRYLKDFGYYWAPSQYWDLTMLATMYEETGLLYDANLRYNKRYDFSGNIKGIYSPKDVRTGAKRERWEIRFRHQQKIGQ
nr:hypothetical protein [Fodinibius sp.]